MELEEKLKKLGFVFPQGEFCNKGKMSVVVDCYPYLFSTGTNECYEFETYEEFYKHYLNHINNIKFKE